MKVLFVKSWIHNKNLNFILKCKKINFVIVDTVDRIDDVDLDTFDAVISPSDAIDVSKYPNTKFIFGPHFSVFPENNLLMIKGKKTVYNLLSNWVINIWKNFPICNDLNLVALPFGVDTDKFVNNRTTIEKNKVMVYFKHRNPDELYFIEEFLQYKNIDYSIFSYGKRYDENEYINYLQDTKYCIWIDAHESQGFALQEALSCNVPLLVWNVTSMDQEYRSTYSYLPATTIPYWDNTCGEIFYNVYDFEETYNKFMGNIESYKPREFILNNLSIEVCENKLIEFINNM